VSELDTAVTYLNYFVCLKIDLSFVFKCVSYGNNIKFSCSAVGGMLGKFTLQNSVHKPSHTLVKAELL
jgi:hypothetical protein